MNVYIAAMPDTTVARKRFRYMTGNGNGGGGFRLLYMDNLENWGKKCCRYKITRRQQLTEEKFNTNKILINFLVKIWHSL